MNAEILCADSRQVYRHLDIGTGKPTAAERAVAPHHLLDVVAPDEQFDVADYCRLARAAMADITARGRPVVVCGGSGLWPKKLEKAFRRIGLFEEFESELARSTSTATVDEKSQAALEALGYVQ